MPIRRSSSGPTRRGPGPFSTSRLKFWSGWDTSVPAPFTDPSDDIAAIWHEVSAELALLTERGAIDSAHAACLDALVSERFAPLYERVHHEYNHGARVLLEFDATGRRVCDEAEQAANEAIGLAKERNDQADSVYRDLVGLERRPTQPTLAEWDSTQLPWRDISLTLDIEPVEVKDADFRGLASSAT